MEIDEFIKEISVKYGYDENLQAAIRLTIPLMLDRYKGREEDVFEVFRDVRIFATPDMSRENRQRINDEMLAGRNSNIKNDETNPYGNSNRPGSYYAFEAIYDDKMDVVGEARWVVVDDITDRRRDDYLATFGTTINIPYFIHEMNHAFRMHKALYRKEGDKIFSKHGICESEKEYTIAEDGVHLKTTSDGEVLMEEMLTEHETQVMLTKFFKAKNYQEVAKKLQAIGHVSPSYSSILMTIASQLEIAIGRQNLDAWCIDNDMMVKEKFRTLSNASKVHDVYFPNEDAYSYLSNKVYEIFSFTSRAKGIVPLEDYRKTNNRLIFEATAPIFGYREVTGTNTFANYARLRESVLGPEPELTNFSKNN